MSNTTEMTASPRLRAMFAISAAIMLALWGWSLVPPIENWGNPNEDGFSTSPSSTRRSFAYRSDFTC